MKPTSSYHLAAAVGVELIVDSPVRTIETNVHCTEIVLAAANKKQEASLYHVHKRGVRKERRPALPGRRGFVAWAHYDRPMVVRMLQGAR